MTPPLETPLGTPNKLSIQISRARGTYIYEKLRNGIDRYDECLSAKTWSEITKLTSHIPGSRPIGRNLAQPCSAVLGLPMAGLLATNGSPFVV